MMDSDTEIDRKRGCKFEITITWIKELQSYVLLSVPICCMFLLTVQFLS